MTKRVLVTGAYGFIGRHVARRFHESGWQVTGLGHGAWSRIEWREWGIDAWHQSDVTLDALRTYAGEPEVIVHCAGSGSVGFSISNPFQDYQRNTGTILELLEYCRLHAKGARIVFPSSAGVYGASERMPIQENSPRNPVSPYGYHKKIAEDLCGSYSNNFKLPVVVIRYFSVYGAGLRKQLLWDACSKLSRNEDIFFGTGAETRDLLHVEDAATLAETAAEHASTACPIVNGGTGITIAIRDVVSEIAAGLHVETKPRFNGLLRTGDPANYHAEISRALDWGWRPKKEWREGIREYVEWYQAGAL